MYFTMNVGYKVSRMHLYNSLGLELLQKQEIKIGDHDFSSTSPNPSVSLPFLNTQFPMKIIGSYLLSLLVFSLFSK